MNVLAVTGTRADWGLLVPVLTLLRDHPDFHLRLVVTGQHLDPLSPSLDAITHEGFRMDHQIDMELGEDDSPPALSAAMGKATEGMGAILAEAQPDLLLVLGDRYEILAVVSAAVLARVPVAHLCGGDVTEGAIDDAIRHAVTKMSALHFVTNADSARRVIQLGEDPMRVFNVGSPGLDRIRSVELMDREAFFKEIGLVPGTRNFLVTFHPPTLSDDAERQCATLLEALRHFPESGLIFTGSNADPGGRAIDCAIRKFVERRKNAVFHRSLGSRRYFSALGYVDAVIGNSSSGIYEAPSFAVPTVNIGDRQARRPRAVSVIDCEPEVDAIVSAIGAALDRDCTDVENPFGDGHAAERIIGTLASFKDFGELVKKSFVDVQYEER